MDFQQKIDYWTELAEIDIQVMEHLFDSQDYNYALYIGHLILEKILKAHYIKHNKEIPPRTHDLLKLYEKSNLLLNETTSKFLLLVNTFNIEARYPDEKMSFYRICTKEFAESNILKIKEIYQWLKSQL